MIGRVARASPLLLLLGLCACAREKHAWFTPNLGSPDMLDLFTRPEQWPKARAEVQVFKFYSAQLLAEEVPCPACGPNQLANLANVGAFSKLGDWGIGIGIEVAALKSWGCRAETTSVLASEAIRRVQSSGGAVRYLAMDEPLLGGETCGYTLERSAAETAAFVRALQRDHPEVAIGDIEPYPHFDAERLATWLLALRGERVLPAFFHLDVDRAVADALPADVGGDLRSLRSACKVLGVPFGVIFWGSDATSDQAYYEEVLGWARRVAETVGEPEHAVFQSWVELADGSRRVPVNLPEDGPAVFSHTRLINQSLALLRAPAPGSRP